MITVVGEALLDLLAAGDGRTFTAHPGGSPANVAAGLARLDVPTTLATRIGDDLPGMMVREHLNSCGVTLRQLPGHSSATNLALAAVDSDGVAQYDFRLDWDITASPYLPDDCRYLHTGSLAASLTPGAEVVEHLLASTRRSGRAAVSFDPNLRPAICGDRTRERDRVDRQVQYCDIVKASAEDIAWIHPNRDPREVARGWLDHGPSLVVVTMGPAGAWAASHSAASERPAPGVAVVDTVGAGDAFTSGILAALHRPELPIGTGSDELSALDSDGLGALLEFASRVAALTCMRQGAEPPTLAECASQA
ncbi:carbohydrate kinase [Haloechinothrix sp. LS1_15]|uniref:carbohydrate kinase family protein n=1 Tax=Haloechinothrix sp. LS1_15 TaxID=2652248 RepID=UPI00294ACC83|nr:carbohydrate kinase [Haloechinothrix sp. LS1_15]